MAVIPSLAGWGYMWRDYTTGTVPLSFLLLDDTVDEPWTQFNTPINTTPIPGSIQDLADYEIAETGGYTQGGTVLGDGTFNFKADGTLIEFGLPSGPTWTGADSFTVAFRYLAISAWDGVLCFVDPGGSVDLTSQPLTLTATESTEWPGTYPFFKYTTS